MSDSLVTIKQQLGSLQSQPDLDKWQPPLSGDIDIRIDANGNWFHEGDKIQREQLVNLFLSILRREEDGEFYLVTPVEKWRIQVDDAPLMVTALDICHQGSSEQVIYFTLSNGDRQPLGQAMPLRVEIDTASQEPSPYIDLPRGLFAKLTRASFYQLVDAAELKGNEMGISSQGQWMRIGPAE